MEKLIEAARGLARNPLGIIALFIVLVYGIAGLVLGTTAADLLPAQLWAFVWFLVGFPPLVLTIFTWLVVKHPAKLYGPGDYRNEEHFLATLSVEEQAEKIVAEVAKGEASRDPAITSARVGTEAIVAEDLALRLIEGEFGQPLRRNVLIKTTPPSRVDGLLTRLGHATVIEVKYLRGTKMSPASMTGILNIANAVTTVFEQSNMVLAVVTSGMSEEERLAMVEWMHERIMAFGPAMLVIPRVLDLDELKARFGLGDAA